MLTLDYRILSREAALELLRTGFPKNAMVVSFYNPGSDVKPLVDYSPAGCPVFQVPVRDIDYEILGQYGLTYEAYLPEADALAAFLAQAVTRGKTLLFQCEYGQSRSAACAAAVLEHYEHRGIEIFADYRYYPNQMVYHKVHDALARLAPEKAGAPA